MDISKEKENLRDLKLKISLLKELYSKKLPSEFIDFIEKMLYEGAIFPEEKYLYKEIFIDNPSCTEFSKVISYIDRIKNTVGIDFDISVIVDMDNNKKVGYEISAKNLYFSTRLNKEVSKNYWS